LGYCLMPNHWHLVLWPRADGDLSQYLRWVTVTHTQRYHANYHTAGTGPLYQGRFKSFPIQEDEHLWTVLRYVERNPVRANLVTTAEAWRWSSLWHRINGDAGWLSPWPGRQPSLAVWRKHVNSVQTEAEAASIRRSVVRGTPFGNDKWTERTADRLGLESSLRPRGRPRKERES
jgi:putative transposase